MVRQIGLLFLILTLTPAASLAAGDPFVGEWMLNPSKTTLIDQMKVAAVSANKFSFDFGGGPETVVADGTDQPGSYGGTTLSVAIEGPNTWRVVRKKDGRMLLSATWNLSADGNTLRDSYTGINADQSQFHMNYVYKRTMGESGFTGTWKDTSVEASSVAVMKVRQFEGEGLSFIDPLEGFTTNVKFDGKDYPDTGSIIILDLTSSARRLSSRHVEVVDKFRGKRVETREFELSPNLKELTITVETGQSERNILVFERQTERRK